MSQVRTVPDCEPGQGCRPVPKNDGRSQDHCKGILEASAAFAAHTNKICLPNRVFILQKSAQDIEREQEERLKAKYGGLQPKKKLLPKASHL